MHPARSHPRASCSTSAARLTTTARETPEDRTSVLTDSPGNRVAGEVRNPAVDVLVALAPRPLLALRIRVEIADDVQQVIHLRDAQGLSRDRLAILVAGVEKRTRWVSVQAVGPELQTFGLESNPADRVGRRDCRDADRVAEDRRVDPEGMG